MCTTRFFSDQEAFKRNVANYEADVRNLVNEDLHVTDEEILAEIGEQIRKIYADGRLASNLSSAVRVNIKKKTDSNNTEIYFLMYFFFFSFILTLHFPERFADMPNYNRTSLTCTFTNSPTLGKWRGSQESIYLVNENFNADFPISNFYLILSFFYVIYTHKCHNT